MAGCVSYNAIFCLSKKNVCKCIDGCTLLCEFGERYGEKHNHHKSRISMNREVMKKKRKLLKNRLEDCITSWFKIPAHNFRDLES